MATKERREELIERMSRMGDIGAEWVKNLSQGKCPLCGNAVNEADFRDELSRKEFNLSHMCQSCQDNVFRASDD